MVAICLYRHITNIIIASYIDVELPYDYKSH